MEKFNAPFIAPEGAIPNSFTAIKKFSVKEKPVKAVLYATALGMYEAQINGSKIGKNYFAPFWTSYNKMLQFQTYDITELLKKDNELAFIVGKGWYRGTVGFNGKSGWYGTESAVACELHITYADGEEIISTSEEWEIRDNFIVDSEIFDGEIQDFNRELKTYAAKYISFDNTVIVPQINEPITEVYVLQPVSDTVTPKGETIIDFGENITGFVEIDIKGKKGHKIVVKHAEILDKYGNFYTKNLRTAKATDVYILNGQNQLLRSHFTFHGFRYICVEGAEISKCTFKAFALSSGLKETGRIVTSDNFLNKLIENIKRSQRDNFLDVPTDCPQRDERCGWTADANVFARTAAYNYKVDLFFEKWLKDLHNDMREDGSVPYVVPDVSGKAGTPALWADAVTMIPYTMYEMYGDVNFLANSYGDMKKYAGKVLSGFNGGLIKSGFQYGDWLALDRDELMPATGAGSTDCYFVANVFFNRSLDIISKSAALLGKANEAEKYNGLRKKHLADIRREYFTETGRCVCETQTGLTLALHFGIVPEKFRKDVARRLVDNIERHGNHLTTGFAGTPYLLFALSDNGYHDKAVSLLLNHGYPGWLYAVDRGATTVWERWNGILPDGSLNNPSMNSFNHYAYGSVLEFIYRRIAGIDCDKAGFGHIILAPKFSKGIESIKASFESVRGLIECGYTAEDGNAQINITVPEQTSATVILPDGTKTELESGKYSFTLPCGNLSPELITMDTKVGDILCDETLLKACNAVSNNMFSSPRIAAVRDRSLKETAMLLGADGEAMLSGIVGRANKLLKGDNA